MLSGTCGSGSNGYTRVTRASRLGGCRRKTQVFGFIADCAIFDETEYEERKLVYKIRQHDLCSFPTHTRYGSDTLASD
jgi:hypothetical protein